MSLLQYNCILYVQDRNGDRTPKFGYNLFTLNQILRRSTNSRSKANEDDEIDSYTDVSLKGAIVLGISDWKCDTDKREQKCKPEWNFWRLDDSHSISRGFNFRKVDYDINRGSRTLVKLSGIRIVFATSGYGYRFSFSALTIVC